ncbi:MAG TPA: hypothetical protein VKA49_06365 [Flavitalea sp.]|nr:hypothetical protein [Flavitalea sp.]
MNSQIEKVLPHQGTGISITLFKHQASKGLGRGTIIVIIDLNRLMKLTFTFLKRLLLAFFLLILGIKILSQL